MKKIIQSFLTLIFILICIETKAQSYSSDPEKFITEIINEAKVILSSQDSQELKAEKLTNIALQTVDLKGLAYYTLGKKRKEISPNELKKYETLFEKYFLKSFTSR